MTTPVTPDMISIIKLARRLGYYTHVIAAFFGINQGRVSEVNTGKRGAGVPPAASLPADFPARA